MLSILSICAADVIAGARCKASRSAPCPTLRGRLSGTGCPLCAERFEAASMQTVFEDLMVMINEGGS